MKNILVYIHSAKTKATSSKTGAELVQFQFHGAPAIERWLSSKQADNFWRSFQSKKSYSDYDDGPEQNYSNKRHQVYAVFTPDMDRFIWSGSVSGKRDDLPFLKEKFDADLPPSQDEDEE